ncbi:putative baseplate assembly protein [Streptomyces europaeiscabiei]|uniref:putative baseplate assembly protein n=1 Tax=Streptomyces TaxID=1883 RepID=UPI000A3C031B|nr:MULTISPECIES: putative baseplate assembly protein [Streptomyces]MDX3588313.1 putative baseplate assembly protein [Streptomyces europaeiscabiei]MDX3619179.1 putative baseplate assembly protein [Streptomyces europaeiscabiei]MDX3637538.1 putative baseplate assembly protein [Streptomyces europaeiscabiei]MDX3655425.1 putative baseplate assembly protein [Streptomyces europaeiscabiei]WUD35581.1 putative baseplate assembly protein [Streptomyces europaeiscabiei]
MALPSPNLDDRRFQQFVDDAKRYIQQRAPEWTDHNVSDPGVTLVETVAHMADQIVYRLNRVPEKNHLAFLDLVGITLFPPSAARTDVTFWLSAPQEEPVPLPVGTEVATLRTESEEAVVFATERELSVVPCELRYLVTQRPGEPVADRTADLAEGKDLMCFAESPRPGDCMLFGLTAAVPYCAIVLELDSVVDGVGVDPRQPPLVWEAWTEDGWTACEVDRDGTGGLNRPGEVVLHMPGGHTLSRTGGQEAGWLRCRVTEPLPGQPFYTTSPTVRASEAFTIGGTTTAVHAETVYDEALGESTGLPGQRLRLAHFPVVGDTPPVLLQTAEHDGWTDWDVVPSFAASTSYDRHITLDSATGEIAFGPAVREPDGTLRAYGAAAPKGSVIRAVRYRTGGGRAGNVARGAIRVLRTSVPYVSEVVNREAARGGVDAETVEEAKVRAPITLRAQERAVTLRDYEELARRAAPETARITCLEGEEGEHGAYAVRVLVVPQAVPDPGGRLRFEQLVPGDALLRRITRHLDERRLIGTRLAVGPPFYQGVTVVATLHAFRGTDTDRVRRQAHDALYRHLDPLTGGADGRGWPFGRPVQSGEVFAVLQRVPGVELVDDVQLHPADPLTGKRGDPTNRIDLSPPSLVFSFDHRVRVIGDKP